jgi:hypothetical protein
MKKIPLRVDFGGGWLDVPKFAIDGAFIVNCAISPTVDLDNWIYEKGSGLGGSAAISILNGNDPIKSELDLGVGWQDPAVIKETGLCVWKSGERPILEAKFNSNFLKGKMALYWTGTNHNTPSNVDNERDYVLIKIAGDACYYGASKEDLDLLCIGVRLSYEAQIKEGMEKLPYKGELAKKYCGGGWGGYALYIFNERPKDLLAIEPYSND